VRLRRELGTPYPLATAEPYVYDKELVLELQERTEVPAAIAIVIRSGQEILLTPETHRFFKKVEFDPTGSGDALRLLPAGAATIEEIADGYELAKEDVRAAVAYEEQFRSLVA
jgi:hypothetical protein